MRQLRTLLSHTVKLFIGPHEEGTPDHTWGTILAVIAFFAFLFFMLNRYM